MDLPRNAFKHALAEGRQQLGLWSQLSNGIAAEIIAGCGFDWIVLDMEHDPIEAAAGDDLGSDAVGQLAPQSQLLPALGERVLERVAG